MLLSTAAGGLADAGVEYELHGDVEIGDVAHHTGKVMAGLIGMVRDGAIGKHENVLFLHTGGAPSLFAYQDVLLS